jgi:small-conductance mechanosensitive channel
MDTTLPTAWYNSFAVISTQVLTEVSAFLPKILAALLVLIIGTALAKAAKKIIIRLLEAFRLSKLLKDTPIEHFLANAEFGNKFEEIVGSIFYWLGMLIVLHTTVTILGLDPLSDLLSKVLNYLPNIISAVLVLFFGTLLAGVVESLVKGSIKSIDGRSSRFLGKISSYIVITVTVLAAISELGIAQEFITILFVGFVAMISLGFGLALGLGGQDVVRKMLNAWYEQTVKEVQE